MQYKDCGTDVLNLVEKVKLECYPVLAHTSMRCVFSLKPMSRGSKDVLAVVRKVTSLERQLGIGYDFILLINEQRWILLNSYQQEALIDHELAHIRCKVREDGSVEYRLVGHDVEEFTDVVKRRGLWDVDLKELVEKVLESKK